MCLLKDGLILIDIWDNYVCENISKYLIIGIYLVSIEIILFGVLGGKLMII